MTAMESALMGLWRSRRTPTCSYLLLNDPRGYFADPPAQVEIDGILIPVHPCRNEWVLRLYTEAERESGRATPKILVSRMQLEPDLVPDLQACSSTLTTSLTGVDLATALGVQNPRPMISRLPIPLFWGLAPFFRYLGQYDFNRVLLASLLDDLEILSAAWTPERSRMRCRRASGRTRAGRSRCARTGNCAAARPR